jgi:hypothetical protein
LLAQAQLFEREEYVEALGGVIKYRELTGQEIVDARQAALADEDHPDNDLYRAMVVSFGLIEPQLEPDDVFALQKGRFVVVNDIANRILELGDATPDAFRDGDSTADDEQRDPGAGDGTLAGDAG